MGKTFELCDKTISFSDDIIDIIDIRREFYELSLHAESEFREKYRQFGSLKNAFENTRQLGYNFISQAVDNAIMIATRYHIFSINRDTFVSYDKRNINFIQDWSNIMSNFENLYLTLEEECLSDVERREFRKEARGRIIGGGFGISGATQGILTAGAVNTATGLAHSLFNSIGNTISRNNMRNEAEKLYNDDRILESLASKLNEIINYIGTILWYSILNFDYNNGRSIIESENIYKNILDNILSVDQIKDVLPNLIYDLWAFKPEVLLDYKLYNLDEADNDKIREISEYLDINFIGIKADEYMNKFNIPGAYGDNVLAMLKGSLPDKYIVSYVVDKEERIKLINELLNSGFERANVSNILYELCDEDIYEPSKESLHWLAWIISDNNAYADLTDDEKRMIALSLLSGRLPDLNYFKILEIGYYTEPKLYNLLVEENLFDEKSGFSYYDNKLGFEIKNSDVCLNIYEAINDLKRFSIKYRYSCDSDLIDDNKLDSKEEKTELRSILDELSKITSQLEDNSSGNKDSDIVYMGIHWSIEERERNASFWLEKAAALGNAKAIDIINNKKKSKENHEVKVNNDKHEQFSNEYYKEELVKVTKKTAKSLLGFTIDKLEQIKKSL